MTNAKYHRCRRALARLEGWQWASPAELATLRDKVRAYQSGGLRAKNGRGKGLHSSNAAA